MSSISRRIPLQKPRQKNRLRDKIRRRKRHGQVTVIQSLSSVAKRKPEPSEAEIFRHTQNMGESASVPHSVGAQVQQGQENAHVVSHDSHKAATDHSRDHTFQHLSTNFSLNARTP